MYLQSNQRYGGSLYARAVLLLITIFSLCPGGVLVAQTIIGGATPDNSSILDVQSTGKGVLFPRMTTAQRDEITSPATSLMLFNTTTVCLEINLGTPDSPSWEPISCKSGGITGLGCNNAELSGLLRADEPIEDVSFSVSYSGGIAGAHDGNVVMSTGITGITATLAPGSFSAGAGSLTYELSGTFSGEGVATFFLEIGGRSCTVALEVPTVINCGAYVAEGVWKDFLCYNLGAANTEADPFTPSWELNGGYWQWGKKDMAAPGPSGPSAAEANADAPETWSSSAAPVDAWLEDEKTAQDPCPEGSFLPTSSDWNGVISNNTYTFQGTWSESSTNYSSGISFGDHLFLPAAGSRSDGVFSTAGTLTSRGSFGAYHSRSTVIFEGTPRPETLAFSNEGGSEFVTANSPRFFTAGYSVRCIED